MSKRLMIRIRTSFFSGNKTTFRAVIYLTVCSINISRFQLASQAFKFNLSNMYL